MTAGGLGVAGVVGTGVVQRNFSASAQSRAAGGPAAGTAAQTAAPATGTLPVPPLLSPTDDNGVKVFGLTMQTGTATLRTGVTSKTAGFNGPYLGPVIKVDDGDRVRMEVTNTIGTNTTVHWHGLHVPPSIDGGPQNVIAPGTTWKPQFTVRQNACTLWFHPHGLGTTAEQVGSGLAGMLLIDDRTAGAAALPSDYGVDQFPLILQSVPVNASGVIQSTTNGLLNSSTQFPLIVNGVNPVPTTPTLTVNTNRVRLHVLNGSIDDVITVARADGGALTQVGTDAALLPSAAQVSGVRLVAGERAEIVLDLSGPVTLQATVNAGGPRGGSGTTRILAIDTTAPGTPAALPAVLNTIPALDTTGATERTVTLSNSGAVFMINGVAGTTMDALQKNAIMTKLNATEVWTITNNTGILHSFHLHDVPYQVLAANGAAPTGTLKGTWKDTIEIPPQSTRTIAMQFIDFADDTYGYMLHCHNALHEDEGMMAMLMVMN